MWLLVITKPLGQGAEGITGYYPRLNETSKMTLTPYLSMAWGSYKVSAVGLSGALVTTEFDSPLMLIGIRFPLRQAC